MASEQLLVDIETIKANAYIEPNVEPATLAKAALEVQRIHVRGVLGDALTDLFLNSIGPVGVPTGLTTTQQTFFDQYLVPMMSHYTEGEFINANHYHNANTGMMISKTDGNDAPSEDAVNAAVRRAMSRGDSHAKRGKAFILRDENKTDLGDYYWRSNQMVTPQQKVSGGMIYTPYRGTQGDC